MNRLGSNYKKTGGEDRGGGKERSGMRRTKDKRRGLQHYGDVSGGMMAKVVG
eukprot:CAMPEP_0182495702 /NCGR_PEP_ID=MMETSP1321-20130603/4456_1 /TAXON_ID=91990 /ORGANISM="Bolidomonas sp., Strain RCC1657" /LENGTH=51 /DNA_ID=CAMNT_0024699143 /DNA_START=262 /DNA_END=414 /DNA_ORIENTATION=-